MSKNTLLDKLIENIRKKEDSNHVVIIPNNISKKFISKIVSRQVGKNTNIFYLDEYIFNIKEESIDLLKKNDSVYLENILENTTSVFKKFNLTQEVENIIEVINKLFLEHNIVIDKKNSNKEKIINKFSQNLLSYESKIFLEIIKLWIDRSLDTVTFINRYTYLLNENFVFFSNCNHHILQHTEYSELENNWINTFLPKLSSYNYNIDKSIYKNNYNLKNKRKYESHDFSSQEEELQFISDDIINFCKTNKDCIIGIINNSRYFTRRLSAILEKNHIKINDNSGWLLSTSSCCSYVNNILNFYIKKDNYINLHDIIMSPYYMPDINKNTKQKFLNYVLVNQKNNINSSINKNIDNFKELQYFEDFVDFEDCDYKQLKLLLSHIKIIFKIEDKYTFSEFREFIVNKILEFNSSNLIKKDSAGKSFLKALDNLLSVNKSNTKKNYFSTWHKKLESYLDLKTFIIDNTSNIYYTDINNALLCSFDKIYISSMNSKNFPKKYINNFSRNNIIYSDFSMDSNIQEIEKIENFLHLSNNAENIFLSFSRSDGEEYFAKSKFKTFVDHFINDINKRPSKSFKSKSNKNIKKKHNFILDKRFKNLTYTDIQNYNSCFYCFFYYKTSPKTRIVPRLSENNFIFGNYVHKILFDLVNSNINFNNYDDIIDNLNHIADSREKEFFLENLSPYKIKLLRKLFPKIAKYYYTDNTKRYNFLVEQDIKLLYKDTITLKGRYDLKYSLGNDNCVVDYKTSTYLPSRKTVLSGEYLQLPFYTLLDTNITSAEYLSINVSTNSIKSDAYSSNDFEDARNIILNTVENIYAHIVNKTTLNVEKNLSGCDICGFSDTNRN